MRDRVECSGTRSCTCTPRNVRSESESEHRHSSPRSDSIPSKYPTKSIRKYTPGATDGRPGLLSASNDDAHSASTRRSKEASFNSSLSVS